MVLVCLLKLRTESLCRRMIPWKLTWVTCEKYWNIDDIICVMWPVTSYQTGGGKREGQGEPILYQSHLQINWIYHIFDRANGEYLHRAAHIVHLSAQTLSLSLSCHQNSESKPGSQFEGVKCPATGATGAICPGKCQVLMRLGDWAQA